MEDKKKKGILDHIADVDLLGGESMFDEKEETTEKGEEEKKEEDEYEKRGI